MLLPLARAMRARGHEAWLLLRDPSAGADLDEETDVPREAAPVWVGPVHTAEPLNFGEILHNFGYQYPADLRALVEAWRDKLAAADAVVCNVAPAAHLAARTLGIPSLEISQGFHIPPPGLPSAPLRDWEPAPRARLEAADRRVLEAINRVLAAHGAALLASIGELFAGRSMLLTYPELDIYPDRGPAEYFGVPETGEGRALLPWPEGGEPRVIAYLYQYYEGLEGMLAALKSLAFPTLALCRGLEPALRAKYHGGTLHLTDTPLAFSRILPQAGLVICHGSHQTTALALLAGKPVLLLPTHLEQFLIMRRAVRQGMGLGIAPGTARPDFRAALAELAANPSYARKAAEFSRRYAGHDRGACLATIAERCEAAIRANLRR